MATAFLFLASIAAAAPPPISIPASGDEAPTGTGGLFGFLDGINRSATLFGDMWGLRSALSKNGIALAIQETGETAIWKHAAPACVSHTTESLSAWMTAAVRWE